MKTDSGIFKEGTYEWNITSLTLMYDDKTEKFGFKFATGMSHGYILQSDKTSEYQQRYPDAGITEVKVNYVWKDNEIIQLGGLTFDRYKVDRQVKLLFLIFCIFTISCSNEDKLNCEPIELSSNSIHILAGEKELYIYCLI